MSHWRIVLVVLLIGSGVAWSEEFSQGVEADSSESPIISGELFDSQRPRSAPEAPPGDVPASTPIATPDKAMPSEDNRRLRDDIPADAASHEEPAPMESAIEDMGGDGAGVEHAPVELDSATLRRPRPNSRGRRVGHPTRTATHQGPAADEGTGVPAMSQASDGIKEPRQPQFDDQGRQILKIAVMAIRGAETAVEKWQPTADYLTAHVPGYRFVIEPFDFVGIRAAMANGTVDFVLTNPGMYVEFESRYGVRRITTLKNLRLGKPYTEFGAVLFKRTDRGDIQDVRDLKGKRFTTVDESAFGGWQMAWRQLLELGVDPYRDFDALYSAGTHDKVVYEVLEGRADAGNVRTDTLERMDQEGKIKIDDLTPIYRNTEYGERFPFWLSTRLYPEWPFAILPDTPQKLAERVAIALMSIPPDSEAARVGRYEGWTVPGNYETVHDTLRMLRVIPYEDYGKITWQAALQQYWKLIVGVLMSLLLLAVAVLRFNLLNRRLSATQERLQEELTERRRAESLLREAGSALEDKNRQLESTNNELGQTLEQVQQMQQQIVVQEKMASLGALTAGIAHEIKNPLNFIVNFSELSSELAGELFEEFAGLGDTIDAETRGLIEEILADLKSNAEKINGHGKRADSIVRNMLEHSRGKSGELRPTDINALLEEYLNLAYHGMRARDSSFNITIERDYDPTVGEINVVPQDLSRVFLNLVNNGCYAVHERQQRGGDDAYAPTLGVSTRRGDGRVQIRIRDNGTGIPAKIREQVFQPFFTTKPTGSGTGLGLSMSYDIITQEHGGRIEIDSEEGVFTEFLIDLPIRQTQAGMEEGVS